MHTLEEIETRLSEIRAALNDPNANLDALEQEMNTLIDERSALIQRGERRRAMLDSIASATNVQTAPVIPTAEHENRNAVDVFSRPEYRTAFLHSLMGHTLTDAETRAMNEANAILETRLTTGSGSAAAAVPTSTANEIVRQLAQTAPIIDDITLFNIPGNMTIAVESATTTTGALHTEASSTAISDASDVLTAVSLGGYEIVKILSISAAVRAMSIDAFESWLVDNLTDGVAYQVENLIFNGTGSSQPQGFEYAATWTANTNGVQWAATTPTYAEICKLVSLLPGVYDRRAKFYMNKKTLWAKIMPIRDDSKAPIVKSDGGQYYIMGYPVALSDKVSDNVMYLADAKMYYANFSAPITVESSKDSNFRKNMVDYRGAAVFDGKVAVAAAFVKGANSL